MNTDICRRAALPPVALSALFLFSCAEQRPPIKDLTNSAEPAVNVLALASLGRDTLGQPWQGQDQDILTIARERSPAQLQNQALGVVTVVETPCPGGGVVTRTRDNAPPPWFSQGDIYTTEYTDCVEGNSTINGRRIYSIDALSGQPFVVPDWTSTITQARQGYVVTDNTTGQSSSDDSTRTVSLSVTNNTSFTQTSSGEWLRVRPNNGTEQQSSGIYTVTFQWENGANGAPNGPYSWDFNIDLNSSLFGATQAETLTTLQGIGSQPPDSGVVRLVKTEGPNTQVSTITATGGGAVTVETDADGDGVVDSTTQTTWNQVMIDPLVYQFF